MTALPSTTPARRRWAWSSAIVLAAILGAAAWWWFRPPPIPDIPLEGVEPGLAKAVHEARSALSAEPRSAEAWGTLGRVLLANEVYPEISHVCFVQAERLDPDNPRWPYLSAAALLNQGKRDDALVPLQRAAALNADSTDEQAAPRMLLAETYAALDRRRSAEDLFLELLDRNPGHPRARFGLGTLLMIRQEWQASREHFEACLGSPQARKKACIHLATVCAQLGDRKNADYYADLATRLPNDLVWTDPYHREHAHLVKRKRDRYELVERFEAEGRFDLAIKSLNDILADYPQDDAAYLTQGRVLTRLGQFELAEKYLRQALKMAPEKVQTHYFLSLALLLRGETLLRSKDGDRAQANALFEESAAAARKAVAGAPDFGRAHMALGRALNHLNRKPEALAALRQAVHCNPEFVDNHLFLGEMLAEEGHLAEARHYLEQAVLLAEPTDSRPKNALDKHFPKVP